MGGPVRRRVAVATQNVPRLAAGAVHRAAAGSRLGSGPTSRVGSARLGRHDGPGSGSQRFADADALQRALAVTDVRFLQADRHARSPRWRGADAILGGAGRPHLGRSRLIHRPEDRPCRCDRRLSDRLSDYGCAGLVGKRRICTGLVRIDAVAEQARRDGSEAASARSDRSGGTVQGWLRALSKTEGAIRMARRKLRNEASKQGREPRPDTLELTRYAISSQPFPRTSGRIPKSWSGAARATKLNRSCSASSPWPSWVVCPNTTQTAPCLGRTQAAGRPASREADLSRRLYFALGLDLGTANAPRALAVSSLACGARCFGSSIRRSDCTPRSPMGNHLKRVARSSAPAESAASPPRSHITIS